jgi:hypothetical protein
MIGFGPLPGPAAMIVMNSYLKTGYVGINLDPAAITEPELLGECLYQGAQEVLSLATSPSKPPRRSTRQPTRQRADAPARQTSANGTLANETGQ